MGCSHGRGTARWPFVRRMRTATRPAAPGPAGVPHHLHEVRTPELGAREGTDALKSYGAVTAQLP
jgi:hypothetical protein